jgi:5-dehydro-2-deoxygluconokinase
LDTLREIGPSAVIVKRGGEGATLFENGERTDVSGVPVEVVNGLGAGDAFAAGLGYAIIRGLGLLEGVRLGNAAGAIVASQVACSEAMPTLEELQGVLV